MGEQYKIIPSDELEEVLECDDILVEDAEEAIEIGEKLIETSVELGGAGIAAPQVGINKKVFAFSFTNEKDEMLYQIALNPQYFPSEKKTTRVVEGCLSYPEKAFILNRFKYIRAIYYTYDTKNKELVKITKNMRGEQAIVFQHECDHLYGKHVGLIGELLKNE